MPQSSLVPASRIEVDGVGINYSLTAPSQSSSDPVMVLLHGYGASLETWWDVIDALAAKTPVLRFDFKGFGFSDKPPDERYSLWDQADLTVGLLRALSLKRVVLVGHSYGGGAAVLALGRMEQDGNGPTAVGLVLIDAASYPQPLPFFVAYLRNPLTRFVTNTFVPPTLRARLTLNGIMRAPGRVTRDRIKRYAYFFDLPGSHHSFAAAARYIVPTEADSTGALFNAIAVPTSIIWGEHDPIIPVAFGKRLHADIRSSQLHILAGTGHVPHEERPAETLGILQKFMDSLL
jgi:pimeloyl-ACP methyl ester carboxylesterase